MARVLRRHHRERIKKARRNHFGRDLTNEPKCLAKAIDTPTPCSCPACGNPRKYFKEKTMQERRSEGWDI